MKKKNIVITIIMLLMLLTFAITKIGEISKKEVSAAEFSEPVTFQDGDFLYSITVAATGNNVGRVKLISYTGNDSVLVIPNQVTYEDKVHLVTQIESGAITERPYLIYLTIPASIEYMEYNAITYNYNLEAIEFLGKTPPAFGDGGKTPVIYESRAELIIYVPGSSVTEYRNALVSKIVYEYYPGSDLYEKGFDYYRVVAAEYNDPQPAMLEENGLLYQVTKKATASTPGTVTLLGIQSYSTLGDDSNIVLADSVSYYGLNYTVTRLGASSLRGHGFKSITVPNSVKYLDKGVFDYGLVNLVLSDNITEISDSVFSKGPSTYNLKYIALPKNLKTVGSNAFKYLGNLTMVTLRSPGVPSNAVKALSVNKSKSIYVPSAGLSKYKSAFSSQIKSGSIKAYAISNVENVLFSMMP
jgi:hypothetical protein